MQLNEAIQEAANEKDPYVRRERIEHVCAFMRFRMGWTATQCEQAAVKSGLTAEQWNDLVDDADRHF